MNDLEKAKELKTGLETGQVTLAEIIAWADNEIAEADEPKDEIIELAMAKTENDAITWLSNLLNNHGG